MYLLLRISSICFLLFYILPSFAQELSVGTIERPPFAYEENGEWKGFSIDIWKEIAIYN